MYVCQHSTVLEKGGMFRQDIRTLKDKIMVSCSATNSIPLPLLSPPDSILVFTPNWIALYDCNRNG